MDDIWIWKYTLTARRPVNAVTGRREYRGALLRVNEGFACLHPWQELGDPPLHKCLDDLLGKRRWPIVRRALRCAEIDGNARFVGSSLLDEIEIPESHATLPWQNQEILGHAVAKGFHRVKLKIGKDAKEESEFLQEAANLHPQLRWRLDANEAWAPKTAEQFLLSLPEKLRWKVDFIEDPCPYSDSTWDHLRKTCRVPLAVDRESSPLRTTAQVMVVKPAIDEPWLLAEAAAKNGQQIIVTSYMEHPLGQCFAAWEAAKLAVQFAGFVGVCGLQTHHLFTPSPFAEQLGSWSPNFKSPGGTGLGFDELLEHLPWKRLS